MEKKKHAGKPGSARESSTVSLGDILEVFPAGLVLHDGEKIIDINEAGAQMFGFKRRAMLGKPVSDFITAESLETALKKIAEGDEKPYEVYLKHKDGSIFPVETKGNNYIYDGKPVRLASFRDITAEKQTTDTFRNLFMSSPLGMYVVQNGRPVFVNTRCCIDSGYTEQELLSMGPLELVHPDDKELVRENAIKILKSERAEPYEYRIITKDGRIKWLMESVASINFNGRRTDLATYIDITDRINLMNTLSISERNFRASLNESPMGIRIIDASGKDLFVNQALLDIFGYGSVDEMEETPVSSMYATESMPGFLTRREKRLRGEPGPDSYEIDIVRRDGMKRRLEVFQRQVLWNGQKQYQLLYNDVTERKQAEEKLRISEENYRNSLNDLPVGVLIFTDDDEILYANRAMLDIYGYEHIEELRSTPREKRYTPQSYADWLARREKRHTGAPARLNYELSIVRKDGGIRHLQAFRTEIVWGGQKYFQLLYMDITEKKEMEDALRLSEENFRHSLDSSPLGVAIITADSESLYVNKTLLDMFGYSSLDEFRAHPAPERYTLESYAEFKEREKQRKAGGFTPHYEVSIIRLDGELRVLEVFQKQVTWNGKDQFMLFYNDITARKRAEIELRESRTRFIELANLLPQIVWEIDVNGRFTFVNQAGLQAYGYTPQEARTMTPLHFNLSFIPEDRERVIANHERMMRGEQLGGVEYTALQRDGTTNPVIIYSSRIVRDGAVVGARGITIDLTERKRAEARARELELLKGIDRMRSELLANVSHELRTPLTAIKGFAGTLLRPDMKLTEADKAEFLQTIDRESDRLSHLINDLLDMSQADAGVMAFRKEPRPLIEIIRSINSTLESLCARHRLIINIPDSLPPVLADEMRIGQVIINLVENATKFSQTGTEISIAAQAGGEMITVSVTDQGSGIPAQYLERIFERFYQVEDTARGKNAGTGLGLSICRYIIEKHGGNIWAQSEAGKGSAFSFTLPVSR